MSTARLRQGPTCSRRHLAAASGAGLGSLALGGLGFAVAPILAPAAQIDATPPDAPVPQLSGDLFESPETVAARLNYEQDAIVAFVRDEIAYEPYPGVLRGAQGTLWARAGNSADQALLLAELLATAQIPYRFAFGALPEDSVQRLASAPDGDRTRAAFDAALGGVGSEAPATPTATDQAAIDQAFQEAAALRDRASSLLDPLVSTVDDALTAAGIVLPALAEATIPDLERSRHAWIQVSDGPDWLDADPSLEDGDTLASLDDFSVDLPADLHHTVGIRLVVEEFIAGGLSRRDVLSWSSPAHRLVNTPIAVAMTGPAEMRDVGVTISDIVGGTVTFSPCLVAGQDYATATGSFVFGAGGGALDPFGTDGAIADGETTGVWLVAEVVSPDASPVTVERALLDRVGPVARAAGAIDPETIAPVTFVPDADGEQTLPELAGLTLIGVEVARLPTVLALRDTFHAEIFGALHLFGPSFASFRNALVFEHGGAAGFDAYPDRPNLIAFTVNLAGAELDGAGMEITADLLLQNSALRAVSGSTPATAISPYLIDGVLNQVAEQVLVEPLVATDDGANANRVRPTVGSVFEAAAESGIEIVAIQDATGLDALELPDDTRASIQASLDAGLVVVAPRQPVAVGETPAIGWWVIDPATGRTWDRMDHGRGYAGGLVPGSRGSVAYGTLGYGRLLNNIRTWAGPYVLLGKCIAHVAAFAAMASDYGNSKDAIDAFIETFKNVNPEAAKGCFG